MDLISNLRTETSYNDSGFSMVFLSASKQTPRFEPRPLPSTSFGNHCSLYNHKKKDIFCVKKRVVK
jgi:hypothetical protein